MLNFNRMIFRFSTLIEVFVSRHALARDLQIDKRAVPVHASNSQVSTSGKNCTLIIELTHH